MRKACRGAELDALFRQRQVENWRDRFPPSGPRPRKCGSSSLRVELDTGGSALCASGHSADVFITKALRPGEGPSPVRRARIRISTDGSSRWMDNCSSTRLLRSLKYECVFLECFRNGERNASQDRALERHDSGVHLIAPFASLIWNHVLIAVSESPQAFRKIAHDSGGTGLILIRQHDRHNASRLRGIGGVLRAVIEREIVIIDFPNEFFVGDQE